jgi:adenosylhomocysteine nucleosidase
MVTPRFGIVAALEREVSLFARKCAITEHTRDDRTFRFYERGSTVLVCCGIGMQAARRATEALIATYQPDTVQSVGYAGALTDGFKVGALVRPVRVIDVSDGSSVEIEGGSGLLLTSNEVAGKEQKSRLAATYKADVVDMEAAAVAKGAQAWGVRFSALKVVSDEYDFAMPTSEQFVTADGRFESARFAVFALLRPWIWSRVWRLTRNSSFATKALCRALEDEFATRSEGGKDAWE